MSSCRDCRYRPGSDYGGQVARHSWELEELCLSGDTLPSLNGAFRDVWRRKTPLERRRSHGADRVTVCDFCRERQALLPVLGKSLSTGTYRRLPLKKVFQQKEDGGCRRVLVPAVRDRVVGRMILNAVDYEAAEQLPEECAGAGVSLKCIIKDINAAIESGLTYVMRTDIVKYFDTIDRDRLDPILREAIGSDFVWGLALEVLRHPDGHGVPQGSSLSSYAANFFLSDIDEEMGGMEGLYRRYVDDIIIITGSARTRRRWADRLALRVDQRGLELHQVWTSPSPRQLKRPENVKCCVGDVRDDPVRFLGFQITAEGVRPLPERLSECVERLSALEDTSIWMDRVELRQEEAISLFSTLRQMQVCDDQDTANLLQCTRRLCESLAE